MINDPRSPQAYIYLGSADLKLEKLPEAESAYAAALLLAPDSVEGHYGIGLVRGKLEDGPGAVAALTKAVGLKPDWPPAHEALGIAYMGAGNEQAARKEQETLASLDPASADRLKNTLDEMAHHSETRSNSRPSSYGLMYGAGALHAIDDALNGNWSDAAGYFAFSLIFALPAAYFARNRNRSLILWGLATVCLPFLCFVVLGMPKKKKDDQEPVQGAQPRYIRLPEAVNVPAATVEPWKEAAGSREAKSMEPDNVLYTPLDEKLQIKLVPTPVRRKMRPAFRSVRQVQFPREVEQNTERDLEQAARDADGRIRCLNCSQELAPGEGCVHQMHCPKYVWDALGWNLPRNERTYLFNRLATAWWCLRCQRKMGAEISYGRQPYTQAPGPQHSNDYAMAEAFGAEEA